VRKPPAGKLSPPVQISPSFPLVLSQAPINLLPSPWIPALGARLVFFDLPPSRTAIGSATSHLNDWHPSCSASVRWPGSESAVPYEEVSAMARISMHGGLCSTCRNGPTCTYPRNSGRPVTQCEEFDGELAAPRNPTDRDDPPSDSLDLRSPSEEKYSSKYGGLCKICDNREICTFPKPEGGVWHCGEYQ
jgi:hypothetical protein